MGEYTSMMVTFVSQCKKKSLPKTRRVLDAFASRIGNRTWQTVISNEGLLAVKKLLRKTASKNTAVSCHWIRSRSRSDFLWVVGNKSRFNKEGVVPVNYTNQKTCKKFNENDWEFLPAIEALTVFAALLHDFGKLTKTFQNKLKDKNKTQSEPLRHEWISLLFLVAIVDDNKSDEGWLNSLISDEIHKNISKLKVTDISNPLKNLPPIASMVAWLILTHHKLPTFDKKYAGINISLPNLFDLISPSWGYQNLKEKKFTEWFKYAELPSKSIVWQGKVNDYAKKLKNLTPQILLIFNSRSRRPILSYARMSLILADHFYSSKEKDNDWQSSVNLFANTDNQGNLKQRLDEHLVGVARQAKRNIKKLPEFEAIFNKNIRVSNNKEINEKSPDDYKWQDDAVSRIKTWKNDNQALDQHQFGFFAVNMASTGKGKTFANAKIMQALSANEESLRYILALGLRALTLQTGDEYRKKINLQDNELAVLIGSKAIIQLHDKNTTGSESSTSLLDNELIFSTGFPEQGLDTVLKHSKDRQFLHSPVLVCTIDHIIQATEVTRGGRHILPTIRLMSSDLVIDEIDDFDGTNLIAIGRLIHLAGMLGRKVMISSATIPPSLAEGYFNVYQSGWDIFAKMRGKELAVGCAWIDEFKTKVTSIKNKESYKKEHGKFIDERIATLKKQPAKRKVYIAQCSKNVDEYFAAVKQAVLKNHQHHNFIDSKTSKKISLGVVRMANINPCVDLTKYLLENNIVEGNVAEGSVAEDTEIKTMAYHSRQVLLMRHEQEKYLDRILERKEGNGNILKDKVIRNHIDRSTAKNIIFVLVATPVEEVGRDHDFDWAVIEPSSYRSFIQLAGRVLRHRDKEVIQPNIAIMQYNYRALKTGGNCVAFRYPGYQRCTEDLTSYDLNNLVNTKELAENLDATNRIKHTQSSELANLEHKVIHQLLTNYSSSQGPESMQGWLDSDWWLTALPQQYVKFRKDSQNSTVFLTSDNVFLEKSKGDSKSIGKDCIEVDKTEFQNLWFKRDYVFLLQEQADLLNKDLEEVALIYGELNLPTYGKTLEVNQFIYNEQLGLTKA